MPSSFVVHMKSNRSLQGLRITSPFVAQALESFGSKELQILDLQNTIKKGKLPCLLCVMCTNHASLTELNLAKNGMTASDAIILAESLEGNQILTELNISSNYMGKQGAIALANIIPGMGALSKLVMRQNKIHGAEAGRAFADMLAQNTVLKELDLSSQKARTFGKALDAAFAKEFAVGISGNEASNDRAISSVNLLKNHIGVDQAEDFVSILQEHPTLKSLCGNKGDETELDMIGKMYGVGDAIMLSAEIVNDVAMLKLDVSNNALCAAGAKVLAETLMGNQVLTEIIMASNFLGKKTPHRYGDADISGVAALAGAIPGMGALASLHINDNMLCGLYFDGSGTYNGVGVAALSDLLKDNSVLKELNMSTTYIGPEGAKVLSLGLSGNGARALAKLDISSNFIGAEQEGILQRICFARDIHLAK
jgi:hypothetical protein